MIKKDQAIQIVEKIILESRDDDKIDKCKDILAKINSLSEEGFSKIVHNTLGEDANIEDFENWLTTKLQERDLQGTEMVQLNEMVSFNLAGINKEAIALHVVPKHVTKEQIRNCGAYLVDALEQLREKVRNGEITDVEGVFAVSDILRLKPLQSDFKELGFKVEEGEEMFRRRFRKPVQAALSIETLLSEEWEERKEKFMEGRPTIEELHANGANLEDGEEGR